MLLPTNRAVWKCWPATFCRAKQQLEQAEQQQLAPQMDAVMLLVTVKARSSGRLMLAGERRPGDARGRLMPLACRCCYCQRQPPPTLQAPCTAAAWDLKDAGMIQGKVLRLAFWVPATNDTRMLKAGGSSVMESDMQGSGKFKILVCGAEQILAAVYSISRACLLCPPAA